MKFLTGSTRSQRIRIYLKVGYNIVTFFRLSPFGYKAPNGEPASFHQIQNLTFWLIFSIISSIQLGSLVLYWYFEALFGQVTNFEYFVVIGLNAMFFMMNACQWYFISAFNRLGGLNLVNASLKIRFHLEEEPPFAYELMCYFVSSGICVFPFIYFPMLILASEYFPGIFRILYYTVNALTNITGISSTILRYIIVGLWSVAVGHSCICIGIVNNWITIFYFATNQYLELLLKSAGKP